MWPNFIDAFYVFTSKKIDSNGNVNLINDFGNDYGSNALTPFENVSKILKTLKENCLNESQHLAIASRAYQKKQALIAFKEFGWSEYFSSIQIYYDDDFDSKIVHLKKISEELSITNCQQILFFDDEPKNIRETTSIGVLAHRVSNGLNKSELFTGLKKFNDNQKVNIAKF